MAGLQPLNNPKLVGWIGAHFSSGIGFGGVDAPWDPKKEEEIVWKYVEYVEHSWLDDY